MIKLYQPINDTELAALRTLMPWVAAEIRELRARMKGIPGRKHFVRVPASDELFVIRCNAPEFTCGLCGAQAVDGISRALNGPECLPLDHLERFVRHVTAGDIAGAGAHARIFTAAVSAEISCEYGGPHGQLEALRANALQAATRRVKEEPHP